MKQSSKVLIGVGIGVITGGIAGFFLASDQGKKLRYETKEKLDHLQSNVMESVKENKEVLSEKIANTGEKIANTTEKAKSWASDIAETAKAKLSNTMDNASDAVDEMQDDIKDEIKDGAKKARKIMDEKAQMVSNEIDKQA